MAEATTPRRVQRSESLDSRRGPQLRQQFPATEKWNNIVNIFLTKAPRGKHRRQFSYVENSFTGKEAVDFMMDAIPTTLLNGRQVTRENCTKLLQKFLEEKHFYRHGNHEGKRPVFKDSNWLYCFFTPVTKPATPKLVRASSFNSTVRLRQDSPAVKATEKFNGHIPTSPGQDAGFDRRRSMSCSNLAELTQYDIPTRRHERRSREPVRVDHTPPCDRTRNDADDNGSTHGSFKMSRIIEKINVRRRRNTPSPTPSAEPRLISKAPISTPCSAPIPKNHVAPALNEIDMWSIYKSCLLTRLPDVVGIDFPLNWHIKGNDVKWNCENVDDTGMVIPRAKSDMYSDYVMRLINYLKMFPFPNENINAVKYDEYQETKVFNVLCSNLEKAPSLLTEEEATAILNAMAHFDELATVEKLTRPVRFSPPITRQRAKLAPRTPLSYYSSSSNASTPMSTISTLPSAICVNGIEDQIAFSMSSTSRSSLSSAASSRSTRSNSTGTCSTPVCRSLSNSLHDMSINSVRSIPGLILTPEIDQRIRDYYSPTCSDTSKPSSHRTHSGLSYTTAKTSFTPFENKLTSQQYEDLILAISLILLTLPTSRRWKLHTLLRTMHKMTVDDNVRLDPCTKNRDIILEKLTKAIVPCGRSISTKQAMDIVSLLISGESTRDLDSIFVVDKKLLRAVREMAVDIQHHRAIATERPELNNAPTPPNNVIQYCQLATRNVYQEQNVHTTDYLLPLLDSILNNENMKPSEKEKKLKAFKNAHPEVYARRLPLGEIQDNEGKKNFFKRVFGK